MSPHLGVQTSKGPPGWRPARQQSKTSTRFRLRSSRGAERLQAPSPTEPGRRERGRVAGIDGLRALAALSILVYHVFISGAAKTSAAPDFGASASKAFNWLQSGVTLFFVLSGFLLFRPYAFAALRGKPYPSLRAYLRNRALRILPLYWFVLIVTALAFQHYLLAHPLRLIANAAFLQNYFPSWPVSDYRGYGISPAWSLCVEVVFYLSLPALGLLTLVLMRRKAVGGGTAVLAQIGRASCRERV